MMDGNGNGNGSGGMSNGDSPSASDSFNMADIQFTAMMIPHHEAAVKMAKDQIANGKNEALKVMAQKMIVEQNNEIDLFKKWLADQK